MSESEQKPVQKPVQPQVLVIGPDGQPIGTMPAQDGDAQSAMLAAGGGREGREGGGAGSNEVTDASEQPNDMVPQPAKVMRIGSMIKQLLDEVRAAPLDEASRNRLRQIHERSIKELEEGLSPDLRDELDRLSLPFGDDSTPSDAELRIAQAQLVGWLEGLFHGIQATLFAQQMAARMQLDDMRQRALPGGPSMGMPGHPDSQPGMPGQPGSGDGAMGGQYL